ncbi:MAG: SRPBCC family protein [Steroidobacteraceae bacterium]
MTSLTLVRRIRARPSIVFEALTTSDGIAQWWGPDAGPVLLAETDVRIGGRFRVRFRLLDGTEHESAGEYLEVVESKRLVMSWQWTSGGEPDEGREVSRIEIDLKRVAVGTEITFTHARLKTEASRASHERGWAGALDKLVHHFSSERPAGGETHDSIEVHGR